MSNLPKKSSLALPYRIAGNFRGALFSWISWLKGDPRNFNPRNINRLLTIHTRFCHCPRISGLQVPLAVDQQSIA